MKAGSTCNQLLFFMLFQKFLLPCLSGLLLAGCVSQTKMLKLMNSEVKLTSQIADPNLFVNHVITEINTTQIQGIKQWPQVRRDKSYCVPLLFFNTWNSSFKCEVGLRSLEASLKPNLEAAVKRQVLNTDFYKRKIAFDSLDYKLEVTVDSLKSTIPFESSGTMIVPVVFYVYWFYEGVNVSGMEMVSHYTLSQAGKVLKQGTAKSYFLLPKQKTNYGSKKNYMKRFFTDYYFEMNRMLEQNATEIARKLEIES